MKEAAVKLRPMRNEDLPDVIAIESAAYEFAWSEGIFQDCLRVGYCCWVLEVDDEIQAYGVMSIGAGESHVLNVCVKPESQRCGHGRMVLKHLIELAHRHNIEHVLLEVRPSNVQALKLYHEAGFNEVGTRRAYYPSHNGKEDALIMALSL